VWMCNRPILRAPFTKKRTHNLGPIDFQKMMCWKVWVWGGGSTEEGVSEEWLQERMLCANECFPTTGSISLAPRAPRKTAKIGHMCIRS